MAKETSEIDWSQFPKPLSSALFDKYTHQSFVPPLTSLNINESRWNECRLFALNLAKKGFIDPLAILYTSFKHFYPNCSSIRSFSRWLSLYEKDQDDFKDYFKHYSIYSINIQSTGELIRLTKTLQVKNEILKPEENFDQIWFLFSISIRIPLNDYAIIADTLILDDGATRLSVKHKKSSSSSRLHCLFALTPSGKFSNQLIICKQGKHLKMNFQSSSFTRIIQTLTGDVTYEHIQQWFEDFISLSYGKNHSAILIDPRTTLLTPEVEILCQKSHLELITIDLNYYLIQILLPIFLLFDKQCSEVNRLDKMYLKSASDLKRIIFTIWCSLRTLKQNEQICQIFHESFLWKKEDEFYRQSLRSTLPSTLPKKKKKKSPVKTGIKVKLPSSTMISDPPSESTPEQIFSYVIQRQISIARASKCLGGMKLDYLKYCLSYKSNSSLMTGTRLVQLNTFMQSPLTVDWLRHLRSLYYWPCAKQLFLREIYQLTGIITRKRTMNMCGNGNIGTIRSCDLQSPSIFWRAFEDIHQIQFDNESRIDDEQWHDDFQQYLVENKLDQEKTELWTIDTFEFPLTKKSTVLQLPEWNDLRPMNLTPKVTVIYAFSNTGQSIEPSFIFPISLSEKTLTNDKDSYNELGHLTPEIFLFWIENYLYKKETSPMVLIFCSRLPVLSSMNLSALKKYQIYPYGYPFTRTLPFRYFFERRVRNNRSTNLMSELWKKKLLDEQRTHVLKGGNCTVENIKYYFQQIWSHIIHEEGNDEDNEEQISFEEKCQQAFQQANIQIKISKKKHMIKLTPKKNCRLNHHLSTDEDIVDQLKQLLNIVSHFKEQVISANSAQILRLNNHIEQSIDFQLLTTFNKTMDNTENIPSPSTSSEPISPPSPIVPSPPDKRSLDENDEPHISKRLRSSCSQSSNTTTMIKWTPPSQELIKHLQSQSTSLVQFTISLIQTILPSIDTDLTDEHSRWLHSTLHLYNHNYNPEKINTLIEIACRVVKISLVR